MPKSKSKSIVRAARSGGLPAHPGLSNLDPLLSLRMGREEPVRLPDEFASTTAATVLRSEYTVTSDAAGHAVFAENTNFLASRLNWTVTAGTTGTVATTAHPQFAAIVAAARLARLVHFTVQVTYIGAEQTSAGYLSMAVKHDVADVNSITVDGLHTGSQLQVKAPDGGYVDISFSQTPRWEDPAAGSFMQSTFNLALFTASGLPASTACFRVRVLRFVEFIPKEGDLFEGEQQVEPHNPGAMSVHGQLSAPATSISSLTGRPGALKAIKDAANAAYHIVQPMASSYMVGKATTYLRQRLAGAALPLMLTM